MTQTAKSNDTYLREMADLIDRFRHLVEIENAAIEKRETTTLRRLMPNKVEAGNALEALWREFQPRVAHADPRDREAFAALAERAAQLRPLVAHNMTLLNAAKITAAHRIEAGLTAWQRAQREKQPSYRDDGRVPARNAGASIHPARLV